MSNTLPMQNEPMTTDEVLNEITRQMDLAINTGRINVEVFLDRTTYVELMIDPNFRRYFGGRGLLMGLQCFQAIPSDYAAPRRRVIRVGTELPPW